MALVISQLRGGNIKFEADDTSLRDELQELNGKYELARQQRVVEKIENLIIDMRRAALRGGKKEFSWTVDSSERELESDVVESLVKRGLKTSTVKDGYRSERVKTYTFKWGDAE